MGRIFHRFACRDFDRTKTIFIHVPKTAGISIAYSLYGNVAGGHTSIRTYQKFFSKRKFNNYFKFTFVRNPWDRLYSSYYFMKAGGCNNGDKRWAENNLSQFKSFKEFVHANLFKNDDFNLGTPHFKQQYTFLYPLADSKFPIDFLGFYENLEEDFNFVKKHLVPNAKLIHRNQTGILRGKNYQDYYTEEMIDIVGLAYAEDVQLFGYNFDNSSLPTQLKKRAQGELLDNLSSRIPPLNEAYFGWLIRNLMYKFLG